MGLPRRLWLVLAAEEFSEPLAILVAEVVNCVESIGRLQAKLFAAAANLADVALGDRGQIADTG